MRIVDSRDGGRPLARRALLAALPAAALARPALAQNAAGYPSRPLRIVLPVAGGGSGDIVARILGQGMTEKMGQPIVVEPKPGAGGLIATTFIAQQPPDGYSMVLNSLSGAVLNVAMQENPTIDVRRVLSCISLIGLLPQVIVVNPSVPVQTLAELLDHIKRNPGRLTYASSGPGTVLHLGGIMIGMRAGGTMEHIPYRGAGPAIQDVIAGNVSMMVEGVPSLAPFIRTGQLRALAIAAPQRSAVLPEVPTTAEAGLTDFIVANWLAIFVNSATPAPIARALEDGIRAAMSIESLRNRLAVAGLDPVGSTSEEAEAFWDRQIAQWVPVVQAAGIKS
jgi:tripartite-type tricarboxylate transporter receptor subunit TctC